jgi:hypothetical protein
VLPDIQMLRCKDNWCAAANLSSKSGAQAIDLNTSSDGYLVHLSKTSVLVLETRRSQPVTELKEVRMKTPAGFDYQATAAVTEAYEKASQSMLDWGQPDIIREIIGKRIIDLASKGERDPDELCEQALKSFGFSERPKLQPSAPNLDLPPVAMSTVDSLRALGQKLPR